MKRGWLFVGLWAFLGVAMAANEKLDILEIRVLGNSKLSAEAIEAAVYPNLGPGKGIGDVEAARQALESAYRVAGYSTVYVDIPEQDVGDDGIVRLKVTEGRLAHVRIEGARYFSARRIRAGLSGATAGEVPNIPELQHGLATLNAETTDRSITPVLAAGAQPGTVDLTLKVDDHLPVRADIEVNDQYTADTSRWRTSIALGYDNLFNRFDSVTLQYQTAPEERQEVDVLAASYVTRWGAGDRNRLAFTYIDSNSSVAAVGTLSVLGAGRIFNAQAIFPLVSDANASHSVSFGAAFKDFAETILLDQADPLQTPISYTTFTLGQSSVWRFPEGEWTLQSSANFGLRRVTNGSEEFQLKRLQGRPNFIYVRADASYRRMLGKWLEARARLGGQYAVEPIIANEQFALGGASSVRGYLEAAELGDTGIGGSLELGLQPRRLSRFLFESYAFYDAGIVGTMNPQDDDPYRSDLASVGLAVNLGFDDHYAASVSWAYPLVPSGRTDEGDSRFLFMMRSSW